MKVFRFLMSMLIAMVIVSNVSLEAYAKGDNPPLDSIFVAEQITSKSPTEISDMDIEKVVGLTVSNQIVVEQLAEFMEKLDKQQFDTMRRLFSERVGIDIQPTKADNTSVMGTQTLATSWAWVETIENVWTWNYNPKIFASHSVIDSNCDGDPSDVDYVFYYPISTTPATKGNLRWTTTNAQVYAAFMFAYGGNLSAYSYNWSSVRLCIGDNGVWAAGGQSTVANSVFIHY